MQKPVSRAAAKPHPPPPHLMLSADPKHGFMVGYARVSTEEQLLDLQLNALRAAGAMNIYEEKVSGAAKKRPQLDLAIKELQPGDTLVVWRLDRLARSMSEFYTRLSQIEAAGAQFRSLTENFDFNNAVGKFVLGILALVAELERQITVNRTRAGMEAARLRGSRIGAPIKFTEAKRRRARDWLRAKMPLAEVARRLDLSAGTIAGFRKAGMPIRLPASTRSIARPSRSAAPPSSTRPRLTQATRRGRSSLRGAARKPLMPALRSSAVKAARSA
jgi:DNA invertase Pin-like site-specific DNA recombinase